MELHEIKTAIDGYQATVNNGLARVQADVKKLDDELLQVHKKLNRPGAGADDDERSEHAEAFKSWLKSGAREDELGDLQRKALNIGSDPDGGYAVPTEVDRSIEKLLKDISPIRRVARVAQVGSANYKVLVNDGETGYGWVGEQEQRPSTDTPQFKAVTPSMGEIYASPMISQSLLEDAFFDVEAWLEQEIADRVAEAEGLAFISGDGINKPRGFLDFPSTTAADSSRPLGTLQHLETGVDGGWPNDAGAASDLLIDLVHMLRPAYRQGAAWLMNSKTLSTIRQLKDGSGNFYLWQQSLQTGQPTRLLGYPVVEAEGMPDIASGSVPIAFGNFMRGYLVVDRIGTPILRDPYSSKPNVLLYARKRVGGTVINSQAIKLLKFAA